MKILFASLVALSAFAAQNATNQPKFEVASVKVVDRSSLGRGGGVRTTGGPGTSDPGRFSDPADTMMGLLMKAFDVESGRIVYPGWNNGAFYGVVATMPPDTTKAQFQAMLQNLLVERFHLAVHHEMRDFPAYELVIDKGGPKLKESTSQPDDGPRPDGRRRFVMYVGVGQITMKEQTTGDLAKQLAMALGNGQRIQTQDLTLPVPRVVDRTGLTGKYTFDVEFSQPGPPGFTPGPETPAADLPDLFVTLRTQLGLRLNKTAGVPVDVIVVDSVDRIPVAN
jgi:uncharacterized protein (TIGR03435 family)